MKLSEIKITPILESIQLLDIPDEEYFSEKYAGYISNSRLKNIDPDEEGTPEKFFTEVPRLYSDSLYFGSAVHELVLQPDAFYLVEDVDRPTAKDAVNAKKIEKLLTQTKAFTRDEFSFTKHLLSLLGIFNSKIFFTLLLSLYLFSLCISLIN